LQDANGAARGKSVFPNKFAILWGGIFIAKKQAFWIEINMKTKILISIIAAGILGTLADVNGGNTLVAPAVAIPIVPHALTAPIASSPGAPGPPTGLRVTAASPATLAAIPPDSPGGYYTNGTTRGCYININSPYWATNQSYGDLVYIHTTNSFHMNPPKTGTNQ
jgi:hypothetical protein